MSKNLETSSSEEEREQLIENPETPEEKIARLETEIARWKELATKDFLTKLENRHGLEEEMKHIIHPRLDRKNEQRIIEPKDLAVLILDIDHFKNVNDTLGHEGGDEVLRQAADFLKRNMREYDIVCRWGGEEFVVILQDMTAEYVINKFYNKSRGEAEIGFMAMIDGKEVPITFSGGVTTIEQGEPYADAIKRADKFGLYKAKESGRNKILLPEKKSS